MTIILSCLKFIYILFCESSILNGPTIEFNTKYGNVALDGSII